VKVPREFYVRDDVVQIGRELLGKVLCTRITGQVTEAIITETEAYAGITDKASHAYGGRRTERTEPMYAQGGTAYVYLCYGIHHLFNVVTNEVDIPHAVLVRAGQPLAGSGIMMKRRNKRRADGSLLRGPGSLGQALGITTALTGSSLLGNRIWIEDRQIVVDPDSVVAGPRIGVDYAEEDAARAYRFRISIDPGTTARP
jgi:DNA-3-methyladenine glycosylase